MNAPERIWIDTTGNKNTGPNWPTKPVWAATEYIRADLYDAQAAEIADLRRQLAEARDKALEEAATRLLLPVGKEYGDHRDYIRAIRALKGAAK